MCALIARFESSKAMSSGKSLDDSAATAATQSSSEDSGTGTKAAMPSKRRRRRTRGTKGTRSSKSVGYATSTKSHDAPMQKRDLYFALDCEMVGVGLGGLDSALARVSIINWDNEIVLDTYVKVEEEVTDYRTFVSGIRPEHIHSESAISLMHARTLVATILKGKILVGHALENDFKVLNLQHPLCDTRDTATYAPFMRTITKENDEKILCPKKLKELVWEKFNREIQVIGKSHSPVEDAVAAMDLYKASRNDWEMQVVREVNSGASAPQAVTQDKRESKEIRFRKRMDVRTGCDDGNQLLFSQKHQPNPMEQYAMPVYNQYQYQNMNYEYPMNHYSHSAYNHTTLQNMHCMPLAQVAPTRRSHQLARAKVVAALHQQRMRWHQTRN